MDSRIFRKKARLILIYKFVSNKIIINIFINYSLHKDPSKSVLDVGVDNALIFSGFDEKMFLKRGGKYVWSKTDLRLDW